MEFFKIKRDIPFMSYGRYTTSISLATFILAVFFLAARGLNFGVDFTGGTVMEVHYAQPADLAKMREQLAATGLPDALVQNFGSSHDVLIQIPLKQNLAGAKLSEQVMDGLRKQDPGVEMRRVEFVGPQVGKDLVENGALALMLVSLGIVGYLWLRFEWKFGLSALIANLHDVVIILGFFAYFQWEFSLSVLAAVLAVLGYSVNESVVVFDRIRENFRTMRKAGVAEIIDNAITRTMSRTIITHGSTQMMVGAMLFFGGETLHYFAMALTIGILFSIYSSVLVASPLLMILGVSREDFLKPEKAEAEEVLP
ncbi:MAG: protein-export membrane protein SecF [Gallionellales bacterium RIFCSPLOWO2_12_FULL_57_18]|nr:MAG: protein-export membrane protein SecF [Gallionellales bacterium RIFCSPLOWO2_02_FULL_57_47]OGS95527.1 MAG: protein-export membrane protein SecF [Gallionellales bacterium RIFCSPLOWO2_12_FULL_57_18]OGT14784.1 MAG: protein-export membrane protein SecF [Gallionellales bacterium RIFCSPHIGHO2_02_FULL_57_16]